MLQRRQQGSGAGNGGNFSPFSFSSLFGLFAPFFIKESAEKRDKKS